MLRLGTRRSRLAMAQAEEVAARLAAIGHEAVLVLIETAGDRGESSPRSPAGVKGLFVAEIVRALLDGDVDLAVHSAKDLPAEDPQGVEVGAVPERAEPFDLLVTREAHISAGATVGTSSLRRRAQLARSRPELRLVPLRGNVDGRLARLEAGEVEGLVLAAAGLARLGISPQHAERFERSEMVPAPGQGALAVQVRGDDAATREIVKQLDHPSSRAAFEAERSLMVRLGGGCELPLGAFAEVEGGTVHLHAVVVSPDGRDLVQAAARGTPDRAAELVAERLVAGGAAAILAGVRAG